MAFCAPCTWRRTAVPGARTDAADHLPPVHDLPRTGFPNFYGLYMRTAMFHWLCRVSPSPAHPACYIHRCAGRAATRCRRVFGADRHCKRASNHVRRSAGLAAGLWHRHPKALPPPRKGAFLHFIFCCLIDLLLYD